nr:hypothetical protein [Actinomycetota bacterium]
MITTGELVAAREETSVAVARVTRMQPDRGEEIPRFLGDLSLVLHVRSGSPGRRRAIILSREGADRLSMFPDGCRFSVSGDLTGERRPGAYTYGGDSEHRDRTQ